MKELIVDVNFGKPSTSLLQLLLLKENTAQKLLRTKSLLLYVVGGECVRIVHHNNISHLKFSIRT